MTHHRTRLAIAAAASVAAASALSAVSVGADASVRSEATGRAATPGGAARATHHTIRPVGTVRPATIKAPPAGVRGHVQHPLPVLRPHGRSSQRVSPPRVHATRTQFGRQSANTKVLQNFDGVDAIQNRAAAGFNLEPPDEGLGAGNGYVANFVNVTGAIYRRNGTPVTGPFYLNTFFRERPIANTSDPRVFYDASSRRWFATVFEYKFNKKGNFSESHIDLAVSRRANPALRWKVYRIPASDENHAGCPCLADYPIMGVDKFNVYITTNEFSNVGFNGSQLYVVSKSQLIARLPANVVQFENLQVAGAPAYHVQPANTYGKSAAEWMMSSLDPNSTSDNRLAVWAVSHRKAVTTGKRNPRLSVRVIRSEGYSFPPIAQTPRGYCASCGKPTTGLVDTDFDAMQEVQYINGRLVGALNTGVTVAGDVSDRSGVAWFVVRPHLTRTSVDNKTRIMRQGYVAAQGLYLLYPHINMTPNGAMAMTFSFGGRDTYLSAAYSTAAPGSKFGPIRRAAAGAYPDNGFTGTKQYGSVGRWGDYSNGQIVPGTNRVWLATQYIPNAGTGYSNWGNRIFQLRLR